MSTQCTGFAVFDVETTGFAANGNDRVVEIGIVRLDKELDVVEQWETLINPQRDLGPTHIHGISAADVTDAPTFTELLVDIWHRFEGAIPVAHNFSFDRRFILAELARAGIELDSFDGICTMNLASRIGVTSGRRKLADLCGDLGVPIQRGHSAGNDAQMCAGILRQLAEETDLLELGTPVTCEVLWREPATPLGITRKKARERPNESPLSRLASRVNSGSITSSATSESVDEYLLTLDRVLEDRVIDTEEIEELSRLALECGLSLNDIQQVHRAYCNCLVKHMLSDGIVTADEKRDLERVTSLLGVADINLKDRLEKTPDLPDLPEEDLSGKSVCFTGTLTCLVNGELVDKRRAEDLASAAGLTVAGSVTKRLDILVVADPDTLSGKAKKARQNGIRIIAERTFWAKLGLDPQ